MKAQFEWYVPLSEDEIDAVWASADLTVDANVLLDLYRYHESTRDSILSALEFFGERVWISHQAGSEFFRNRKSVIASSDSDFRDGAAKLEELQGQVSSAVSRLRGYRQLNRDNLDALGTEVGRLIEAAKQQIADNRGAHPNFLKSDPILDRLLTLFENKVGSAPTIGELAALHAEGSGRVENSVPPGYLDAQKSGDGAFGDFILWRQTLDHAKSTARPVILVTSEQKEDWWEKHSGRTVGPRPELLREARLYAGQTVMIYQTARFLEAFSGRSGTLVSAETVDEVRSFNVRRPAEPAVRVYQNATTFDVFDNEGVLEVELSRAIPNFTGTGRLDPPLLAPPETKARLVRAPDGVPTVQVAAGTGTTYDFNIHIKSLESGKMLPIGSYLFEYKASVMGDVEEALDREEFGAGDHQSEE